MYLNDYTLLLLDTKKLLRKWPRSGILSNQEKLLIKQAIEFLVLVRQGDMAISKSKLLPSSNQLVAYNIVQNALSTEADDHYELLTATGRKIVNNTILLLNKLEGGIPFDHVTRENYDEAVSLFSRLVRHSVEMADIEFI